MNNDILKNMYFWLHWILTLILKLRLHEARALCYMKHVTTWKEVVLWMARHIFSNQWHSLAKMMWYLLNTFRPKQNDRLVPMTYSDAFSWMKMLFHILSFPHTEMAQIFFMEDSSTCTMMTSSHGNAFRVTTPLWGNTSVIGGFPPQRALNSALMFSLI